MFNTKQVIIVTSLLYNRAECDKCTTVYLYSCICLALKQLSWTLKNLKRMFKSRFCILLWQCSCWKRCKTVFERGLICWASCRGCRHKCVWEAQAVRSQKDYLQISYPGLTFPKKSLLAFFLVFLTAAHRVTLSDCLQRPADGLRKSRQHFILIFGEGEIVLFEEETLVEGRKVQLGGSRGQSKCTIQRTIQVHYTTIQVNASLALPHTLSSCLRTTS